MIESYQTAHLGLLYLDTIKAEVDVIIQTSEYKGKNTYFHLANMNDEIICSIGLFYPVYSDSSKIKLVNSDKIRLNEFLNAFDSRSAWLKERQITRWNTMAGIIDDQDKVSKLPQPDYTLLPD